MLAISTCYPVKAVLPSSSPVSSINRTIGDEDGIQGKATGLAKSIKRVVTKELIWGDETSRLRNKSFPSMKMATLSIFAPFNQAIESWDSFLDCIDCSMVANDYEGLPGDRKQAIFLSICGYDMFETAMAVLAPQKFLDVSWETLLSNLRRHYIP